MPDDRSAGPAHGALPAVQVFGGPSVSLGGRALPLSPYQAFLVGLVFGQREGRLSRSQVTNLLWEEDGPDARHRLSQLLYSFARKPRLSGLFEATPEAVGPGLEVRAVELDRLHQLVAREDLSAAADLLERGFLPDLPPPPTRTFQEWLDGRRASLRSAVRNPAASLWSRFSAEESWNAAARSASVLLRLDPMDEGSLRNVLWSRGMAGRVHEALAEYRSFQERLEAVEDTDGWRVRPETQEIVRRLEALRTVALPPPEVQNREPEPEPRLCGRDEALAALSRAVAWPGDSALTTVLVTGEAGMGKTRLVEEAIRGARLRGFRVLRAGSSEFEGNIPLNPLLEALDDDHTAAAMDRLDDPWHSVLLSLMPQFHHGDGPLPEVPYVDPGSLPRRTYEAVRRLVVAIVNDGPVLLFLDDFQWADETSVAAVEFLRRRWSGGRLVLILALRTHGVLKKTRGEEFAEDLIGVGDALHLRLEELDEDAAASLIDEVADGKLDENSRRQIAALAGRNPFFAVELTHEFLNGNLDLSRQPGTFVPVPVSIRQLVEPRFDQLSQSQRLTLEALSVYGHPLALTDVATLTEEDSLTSCAGCLDRLRQLRLVRWSGRKVLVRHELIRHTVYGNLSAGNKAFHHERVARWLREDMDSSPDELALHFDQAGLRDDALEHALEAAERAEGSGAVPEAVRFLTMARRNTDDPPKAADIVGRLGHLHYLHRNFTEAAPLLDLAAERFRQQGRLPRALRAEVERLDALSRLELIPLQDFVESVSDMKSELTKTSEWETLAKLLDVEIHALDRIGDIEGVNRVLDEAERIADRGSAEARCAARAVLALNLYFGSPKKALTAAREAVAIARSSSLTDPLLNASNRLILTLIHQGLLNTDEGENAVAEAESIAARSGDRHLRFMIPANLGAWYLDTGHYEQARACFAEAERIVAEHAAPELEAILLLNRGELAYAERRVDTALMHFREARELQARGGTAVSIVEIADAGVGLCVLYQGMLHEALEIGERLPEEPVEWVYDRFLPVLFRSELLRTSNCVEQAVEFIHQVCETIRHRFLPPWLKLKLRESKLAARWDEDWAERERQIGLAVAQAHGLQRMACKFQKMGRI